MGESTMALGPEDLKQIVDYAKPWLRDAIMETAAPRLREVDTQLLERMVRVEEELKAQRELMAERFSAVDRRFEDMLAASEQRFGDMRSHSDQRFAAMDKRFDESLSASDKRFADMRSYSDKRFAALQWTLVVGFTIVTAAVTVFGLLA